MSKNLLNKTQFEKFRMARKYKRASLRDKMAIIKPKMDAAYDAIRYEQWYTDPVDAHAGPNNEWCRVILCSPDGMGAKDVCKYFSFTQTCTYDCECCNKTKNQEYFALKQQYDALKEQHTALSWRSQIISLIRGRGFSL